MCKNNDIYSAYKVLRNHLRKCETYQSLAVIKAYVQNLQFNSQFPPDVYVLPEYLKKDGVQKMRWISEWNLEILAREVIINSPEKLWNPKTFNDWDYFSGAINKIKDIEGAIAKTHISSSNVLKEMHRIAHSQFSWQVDAPNRTLLTRYYRIFNTPELNEIILKVSGLNIRNIYLIGVAFLGGYLSHFAITYPINIQIPGLDKDSIDKFLSRFSLDILSLRKKLIQEQDISDKFFYAFSSLRAFPIISMDCKGQRHLVCPVPTLLFWRYTAGLYYEICKESGFDNAFGSSFQKYIGDCIFAAHTNKSIGILSEEHFMDGKDKKATVDWIILDGSTGLFIECKAKRMTRPSKTELQTSEALDKDLEKIADAVVQVYKTIKDYREDKYPSLRHAKERKVYPLVVTLEDWHLFGDNDDLKWKIETKLTQINIPADWISEMPFTICSAQEFEQLVQVLQSKGIEGTVVKKLNDIEKRKWAMTTFLSSEYPEEYKKTGTLFPQDYDEIFSPVLGVSGTSSIS